MKTKEKKYLGKRFLLGAMVFGLLVSCTDLEVELEDSVAVNSEELGFTGVADPSAFTDNMFNSLRGFIGDQANTFALSEVTTDAALIPTRGGDWGDNGLWRQLHQHNWNADHPFFATVFSQWNNLHFQASQVLDPLSGADVATQANASFLRGLGLFMALDNFRQVPFREPSQADTEDPSVLQPSETLAIIEADLAFAIDNLPTNAPGGNTLRPGKAAARYLLAKVLLNKHVYLETTPDAGDMNSVVSLVDAIEGDGFGLETGYFDIFREASDNETIWHIDTAAGNRIWNGLHYNQAPEIAGGGWNGFSTLAEYYDLFEGPSDSNFLGDGQEERRGYVPTEGTPFSGDAGTSESGSFPGFESGSNVGFGFLIGQQYEIDGTPLTNRQGGPLVFARDFVDGNGTPNLINNSETTGIRTMKYNPRYGGFANHVIFFRYSDAHLMKAEAQFRGGAGDASATFNELRLVRGVAPVGAVAEQDLIDERGRELYMELWRRNDLVRFGQYTDAWEFKVPNAVDNPIRNIFPIPAPQLIANPNITQNPGY